MQVSHDDSVEAAVSSFDVNSADVADACDYEEVFSNFRRLVLGPEVSLLSSASVKQSPSISLEGVDNTEQPSQDVVSSSDVVVFSPGHSLRIFGPLSGERLFFLRLCAL